MTKLEVVDPSERLWRRIHDTHWVRDGEVHRPSSAAFKDPNLSVDRATIVEDEMNQGPAFTLGAGVAVAELITQDCLAMSLPVVATPVALNPAHAEIRGDKSRAVSRSLQAKAVVIHTRV